MDRQRSDENVQLFAERILTLGTEAYQGFRDDKTHEGLIEKQLVGFFIDGLNNDQLKVKLMRDNPQRLADAVNTALMEIGGQLPSTVKLPASNHNDIWEYYQFLSVNTIMTNDHILVITSIPLLDHNGLMGVFMVHNIIMPYCSKDEARDIDRPTLTTKYNLEGNSIALNRQRTKYLLFDDQEISQCSIHQLGSVTYVHQCNQLT